MGTGWILYKAFEGIKGIFKGNLWYILKTYL